MSFHFCTPAVFIFLTLYPCFFLTLALQIHLILFLLLLLLLWYTIPFLYRKLKQQQFWSSLLLSLRYEVTYRVLRHKVQVCNNLWHAPCIERKKEKKNQCTRIFIVYSSVSRDDIQLTKYSGGFIIRTPIYIMLFQYKALF